MAVTALKQAASVVKGEGSKNPSGCWQYYEVEPDFFSVCLRSAGHDGPHHGTTRTHHPPPPPPPQCGHGEDLRLYCCECEEAGCYERPVLDAMGREIGPPCACPR